MLLFRCSPSQMLLSVQRRVPGTLTYECQGELVWDVSHGAKVTDLRQRLADWAAIPVERVAMAKHLPEKYEWMAISEIHQAAQVRQLVMWNLCSLKQDQINLVQK